jgi:hypothetical protein
MESDIPHADARIGPSGSQATRLAFTNIDPENGIDASRSCIFDGNALERAGD